jgi:hypothetical protein
VVRRPSTGVIEDVLRARAEQIVARVGYPAVEVWDHTGMIYRAKNRSWRNRPA